MINQFRFSQGQFTKNFQCYSLKGSDLKVFLQSQASFDTDSIPSNHFHLVSFLDPQGRVEFYGWLLNHGDSSEILVPENLKEEATERLHKFLISEDVEIEGPTLQSWNFLIGADALSADFKNCFSGEIFGETAQLRKESFPPEIPVVPEDDLKLWQGLTGSPSFDGSHFQKELITNSRLFDLTVSMNKGCYPGQETVSKIATRRGAAYSPVLIQIPKAVSPDVMTFQGNKIGTATDIYVWQNKSYLSASVLRDFRVENMMITFHMSGEEISGIVKYYPLLSGTSEGKALELYYEAMDDFKNDQISLAEEKLKLSLKLNPSYADAYESLGVMLGREERFPEAIELMEKLSQIDPSSVLAHTNMSLYLMRLGKIDEAEEQKSQATLKSFKKFGAEAKSKAEEARALSEKKAEQDKREGMYQQVLEIDADDTLANYGLGAISVEKMEYERARIHLEKVIQVDPKYSVAYLALGKAYQGLGDKTRAREIYKEGIKIAASKGDLMPANQMQSELERL